MTGEEKKAIEFAYEAFDKEEFLKRIYGFIDDSIALEKDHYYRRVVMLAQLDENIKKAVEFLNKNGK